MSPPASPTPVWFLFNVNLAPSSPSPIVMATRFLPHVNIHPNGTWLSFIKKESSPKPFSNEFIGILESKVSLLMDVLDESPEWLRDFLPPGSPALVGLARVVEDGNISHWEISLGVRGEVFVSPTSPSSFSDFLEYVGRFAGDGHRERRAFARLVFTLAHPDDSPCRENLLASRSPDTNYDGDDDSTLEEMGVPSPPFSPFSSPVASTSSIPSYAQRAASGLVPVEVQDIRLSLSPASSTVRSSSESSGGRFPEDSFMTDPDLSKSESSFMDEDALEDALEDAGNSTIVR